MRVVAAHRDSVVGVRKRDGENPRRRVLRMHRRFADGPGLAAVLGAEDSGHGSPTGGEPYIFIAMQSETGVAGRKCAFILERRRERNWWHLLPGLAAIFGREENKLSIDWIAQYDSVFAVPEGHRIEEDPRTLIFEHFLPSLAAVDGAIDSGLISFCRAGTDDDGGLLVESAN